MEVRVLIPFFILTVPWFLCFELEHGQDALLGAVEAWLTLFLDHGF
ncbi:hypothetical protein A2U01_0082277 [Trifolium medium]|uniref:Uncharacterized protein n=1 Tax=Trifolium medium TaxID=97028 RepID=A0A392TIR5_9FABA|nr:hypothetical protein [Trifolium medium]